MKVTVIYSDDNGVRTSGSKEIKLEVLKNPVSITASVDYANAVDGGHIAYGTKLANVELTGSAICNGETVTGTFLPGRAGYRPPGANNGKAMYKVLFTP